MRCAVTSNVNLNVNLYPYYKAGVINGQTMIPVPNNDGKFYVLPPEKCYKCGVCVVKDPEKKTEIIDIEDLG